MVIYESIPDCTLGLSPAALPYPIPYPRIGQGQGTTFVGQGRVRVRPSQGRVGLGYDSRRVGLGYDPRRVGQGQGIILKSVGYFRVNFSFCQSDLFKRPMSVNFYYRAISSIRRGIMRKYRLDDYFESFNNKYQQVCMSFFKSLSILFLISVVDVNSSPQ